jgi:outer membrane protein OmpA-like peptidoglycan-associated protein
MKQLNKLVAAMCLFAGLSTQAQDQNNPWALTFGVNAVDTRVSAASSIEDQFSQYFNARDNWNIIPSVSYLNVSKYVGSNFTFGVTGSVNKIKRFVNPLVAPSLDYNVTNPGDLMYYGIDGVIKYSFASLLHSKVIDPSAHIGGGYTFFGDASAGTVNGGLGLTFWFTEQVGLSLQSTYKFSFDDNGSLDSRIPNEDVVTHMQHFAGLTFKFGGKDTDKDGIYDREDACPEVAGLKQFKGCPDTDGDGIIDGSDECPEVAGPAEYNGCPDTDKDGIADKNDACPEVAGLKELNGCPDADGDGLADKDDKCPTEAGPKENGGCPVLDADKDGVPDLEDACPIVAGPVENKGCPVVTDETLKLLRTEARSIFFVTGKSTFDKKQGTEARLDAIKEILVNYPTSKFEVNGHTDNVGNAKFNQKLSESRAKAVVDALVARGISADRLTSKGFGSSKPVSTNKTAKGRAENRRTEVIYYDGVDALKVNK